MPTPSIVHVNAGPAKSDASAFCDPKATALLVLSPRSTVVESGSTIPDSGATHTLSAHGTVIAGDDDATSTITVSARTTALSTVTSALGVSGAAHTPDHDVHTSSGRANAIPTPIGVVSGANLSISGDTNVDMAPPMPECDPTLFDGKFLFFSLIFYINIYMLPEPDLDIEIDPQGSSHSHGGHLHGNA